MKVGIIGAGGIGFALAGFLIEAGHQAHLWSPSGQSTAALAAGAVLQVEGAFSGSYTPKIAASAAKAVTGMDAIIIAAPANAHRQLFDVITPHITAGQVVIISAHQAFGALYLARALAARGVRTPIVAWGTTVTTGSKIAADRVRISTVRAQVDMATLPADMAQKGLDCCRALFGDRFLVRKGGLMAVSLGNLNPQNHMALALTNLTRMERGEDWPQFHYYTPAVGKLIEALDAERLAIAAALDCETRSIFDHLHLSYHLPIAPVSDMLAMLYERGATSPGPTNLNTRYVTEDCPYGLVTTALLAAKSGVAAPLHVAGIDLFSALYGRDFRAENDLAAAIGLEDMPLAELQELVVNGYPLQ